MLKFGSNFPIASYETEWLSKFEILGVSNSTGFDWQDLRKNMTDWAEGKNVSVTVKAGFVLKVHQVVGECGSRTIRTNKLFEELVKGKPEAMKLLVRSILNFSIKNEMIDNDSHSSILST